jgi:amino acid adenylation domain-containing protein
VVDAVDSYPLSNPQLRMWFCMALARDPRSYLVPFLLRISGVVSHEALGWSVRALADRHELLRARFVAEAGQLRMRFEDAAADIFRVAEAGEAGDGDEAVARAVAEGCRPLDLATDPPFRAVLYPIGEDDHLLLLALHHLVTDGVSMNVLFEDLGRLYAARSMGAEPGLPPPPRYVDVPSVAEERLQACESYWRTQLRGARGGIDWPAVTPHEAPGSREIRFVETVVPTATVAALREAAAGLSVTPYVLLLTAYRLLLHLYTGQAEALIGVPCAGRGRHVPAGVVGLFVNTLPLRIAASPDESGASLAARIGEALRGARAHDDLPVDAILREAGLAAASGGRPPVATIFNYRSFAAPALEACGLSVELRRHPVPPADTELSVHLEKVGGRLLCRFDYRSDLFSQAQVERMADTFTGLVERLAEDPHRPVRELARVGRREEELQARWGTGPSRPVEPPTAAAMVAAAFAAHAERPAIAGARSLTYRELAAEVENAAAALRAAGVSRGAPVMLRARRSPEYLIALLAAVEAGGTFVPVATDWPLDRLRQVVAALRPALILVDHPGEDQGAPQLPLSALAKGAAAATGPAAEPGDPAYIIFTSGSTGQPKGVAIRHDSLANQIGWFVRTFGLDPGSRVLARTAFWFDASIWEIFATLAAGGLIVLADEEQACSAGPMNRLLREHGVTDAQFAPSLLAVVLGQGAFADASLRRLYCGGEALTPTLAKDAAAATGARILNLYGPTEATVQVAWSEVPADATVVPIGRPVDNARLVVLDEARRMVPAGVPGELWIIGLPVAAGYVAQATSDRFAANPLGGPEPAYRTGDMVRWLDDGQLHFVGRNDSQVKVRGQRTELGEIEAALVAQPEVASAAAHYQATAGGTITGFVTARQGCSLDPAALRDKLRHRLAPAAVPTTIVILPNLPLLSNGKVDRNALAGLVPNTVNVGPARHGDLEALAAQVRGRRNDEGIAPLDRIRAAG